VRLTVVAFPSSGGYGSNKPPIVGGWGQPFRPHGAIHSYGLGDYLKRPLRGPVKPGKPIVPRVPPRVPRIPKGLPGIAAWAAGMALAQYQARNWPHGEDAASGLPAELVYDMSGWTRFGGVCSANIEKGTHWTAHYSTCNVAFGVIGSIPAEPNWNAPGALRINWRYNDNRSTTNLWRKYWNYYQRNVPHPKPPKYFKYFGINGEPGSQDEAGPNPMADPAARPVSAPFEYPSPITLRQLWRRPIRGWNPEEYSHGPHTKPEEKPPVYWQPGSGGIQIRPHQRKPPRENEREGKMRMPPWIWRLMAAALMGTEVNDFLECLADLLAGGFGPRGQPFDPKKHGPIVPFVWKRMRYFQYHSDSEIGAFVNCLIVNQIIDAAIGTALGAADRSYIEAAIRGGVESFVITAGRQG